MQAVYERFDGTQTIQNPSNIGPDAKIALIPRRDMTNWDVVDYMRFDKTNRMVNDLPLFKQSDQPLTGMPYRIMQRDSQPSLFVRGAK